MAGNYESDPCEIFEVGRLILPNGQIKPNVKLNVEDLVGEEKERLLREANILQPELYVMVLHGPHGLCQTLDDTKAVESVVESLTGGLECELHIKKRNVVAENRQERSVNTGLFNVHLK